jgi:ABC-type transport system involved in multi-copper enzyme maturation permease subunit
VSWHGISTVARLELRQRARASKWVVVLGIWFAVIALVSVLSYLALNDPDAQSGAAMYDVVIFFVLGLGMLVVPSLTATSINGDREHGVLATLQTTLLTSADLVLGKLLAAWAISGAFLVTALPFLAWAWVEGGVSVARILLAVLVLMLVLAVVCALGLMFSTLTARPVASAVLTYLALGALVFGTVIGFGLSAFLVNDRETVRVYSIPNDWFEQNRPVPDANGTIVPGAERVPTRADCVEHDEQRDVTHTERIWWMLPLNPFVVVADAAPSEPPRNTDMGSGFTPMRWISEGSRAARVGETGEVRQECWVDGPADAPPTDPLAAAASKAAVWPFGLVFLLLMGSGATAVAERRLRTPVRRLPNGTRIA